MNPQIDELAQFVKTQTANGVPRTAIEDKLRQSGWVDEAIGHAFLVVSSNQYQPATDSVRPILDKTPHHFSRHKLLLLSVIVLVFIIFIVLLVSHHSKPAQKTLRTTSAPTNILSPLQINARNVSRKNDVSSILSGIAEYISNNNGTLPFSTAQGSKYNTLSICGSDCSSTYSSTITLQYYPNKPSVVSFRNYVANLKVPNADTVYIVAGASCNSASTALGATQPRNVAVLYGIEQNNSFVQQCTNE